MRVLALTPMLQSGDLDRAERWYGDRLGMLEFAVRNPDGYLLSFGQRVAARAEA